MADKFVVWLTGLSGAGKSTLAAGLKKHFDFLQTASIILDGDAIRSGLNADLGFSREDRRESLRRMAEVARLFLRSGIIPIVAAISPYAEDRTAARRCFKDDIFIEVFVRCPVDICEHRDVKGLYKAARSGKIQNFTGISDEFQEPLNPSVVIDTATESEEQSLARLKSFLDNFLG